MHLNLLTKFYFVLEMTTDAPIILKQLHVQRTISYTQIKCLLVNVPSHLI